MRLRGRSAGTGHLHELDHLDGHMYVEKVEGEIHDVQYADPEDEEDWEEMTKKHRLCQWELKAPADRSQSDCVHEQAVKADCECLLYIQEPENL